MARSKTKICTIDGCEKFVECRGLCSGHYTAARRSGDIKISHRTAPNMNPPEKCTHGKCSKQHYARDLCIAHYTRLLRHGDPSYTTRCEVGAHLEWIEAHVNYDGEECLSWPFKSRSASGSALASIDGILRSACRVICEMRNGPPPDPSYDCCHNCGKGHEGCMNPNHLRWDTRKGNFADMVEHGTRLLGVQKSTSKLTEDQVRKIRKTVGRADLVAKKYGISYAQVFNIRSRKQWSHVNDL